MTVMKKDIIAIDLHGTLLNEHWKLPERQAKAFWSLFSELKHCYDFYICTGNDYSFLTRYLTSDFLTCFTGFILETGCVYRENGLEQILISPQLTACVKQLESDLKSADFPFIHYFATRKASISMFTHTEQTGTAPDLHYPEIKSFMANHPLANLFYVTWSNVAIDIIPKSVSKLTGVQNIADGRRIISLVDSMNDFDLAVQSDLCFLPANSSKKLLENISYEKIDMFREIQHSKGIYLCNKSYSEGVIEAMSLIRKQT
ncbi:MAG TPA: hypothetical protein PK816_04190 [Candidatus Cloacimonadota bacterium]|nr:hypothetical protein [Candidatus Cloacimonadota bacterium]